MGVLNPDMGAFENKWGTPQNAPPVIATQSNLITPEDETKTATLSDLQGKTIHAIAGIHNPTHFFSYLRNHNVNLITHQFPDHHIFTEKDIKFDDNLPVVMTEKDAVKCLDFTVDKHWYLPISVELPHFTDELDAFMRNEYAIDKMQVEMGKKFKRWHKNRPWKREDG